jgi:uncharacterized tellurite resistance protein B-like protein
LPARNCGTIRKEVTVLLNKLRHLMFGGRGGASETGGFSADERQLAQAALMFHVIAVDGTVTDEERGALTRIVSRYFGLGGDDVSRLIEEARQADSEAIDLYGFTRTLKRELDAEERLELIRNLWKMVYADGVVHEFEDNIVWRVAELLDVSTRDRMEIKRQVSGIDSGI